MIKWIRQWIKVIHNPDVCFDCGLSTCICKEIEEDNGDSF